MNILSKAILLSVALVILLNSAQPAHAVVDPLSVPNNKFGIHIIDENDLEEAARLVNSNGGEWGYVTVVIAEGDRDIGKWQSTFNRMRRLKLIPIVRLATSPSGDFWKKPAINDADAWVDFLNSLNWVVENRYVVLFNEPNHAAEWGGNVDPQGYARVTLAFIGKLKEASDDFFVLPAGIDLAASTSNSAMSASDFYSAIADLHPEYFTSFDGWTSHSYPNPNFSGSVYESGQLSIRGYQWELNYVSKYGVPSNIPVFITETGWAHREGAQYNYSYNSADAVSKFLRIAYSSVWTDKNIVMISPFVLNYQDELFDHFSWRKYGSSEYYPQFRAVSDLSKDTGNPKQISKAKISLNNIPENLRTGQLYFLPITITNIGQSIWEGKGAVTVKVLGVSSETSEEEIVISDLEPFKTKTVKLPIKPREDMRSVTVIAEVMQNGEPISDQVKQKVSIIPQERLGKKLVSYINKLFRLGKAVQ